MNDAPLRLEYRRIETLIPFARNPRTHSEAQVAKIAASIVPSDTNPVLLSQVERGEEWKPIPGYSNYEVSSHGRVRRATRFRHYPAGMLLKPRRNQHGYMQIALSRNGKYGYCGIHRVVALAFLGSPPSACHEVAHGDGNRINNRIENLRWVTPVENAADRSRHNNWTLLRGELHHQAVLTDKLVLQLRAERRNGRMVTEIAREFDIAKATAYDAIKGKTWTHLPV